MGNKPSQTNSWDCDLCTFLNNSDLSQCEMCGALHPSNKLKEKKEKKRFGGFGLKIKKGGKEKNKKKSTEKETEKKVFGGYFKKKEQVEEEIKVSPNDNIESGLQQIVTMGFDEDAARFALALSGNNVENAINHLLSFQYKHEPVKFQDVASRSYHLLSVSKGLASNQCNHILSECDAFRRIRDILSRYKTYISSNDKRDIFKITYGEFWGCYDNTALLNDFNHCQQAHSAQFEDIYNMLTRCDLRKCLLIKRNQRDRVKCVQSKNMKDLYFSTDDKVIVFQQILDRIHCFYSHSFDIGNKIKQKEQQNIYNQEMKMNGNEVFDKIISGISRLSSARKNKYRNVEGLERIYNTNNKFSSPHFSSKKANEFKYGWRFFYWSHYKDNHSQMDHAQLPNSRTPQHCERGMLQTNLGYDLADFYIVQKFGDLKEELTQTLALVQWTQLMEKAQVTIETILYRSYSCPRLKTAKFYDMNNNDLLSTEHLIAIMVYCNFDELQRKFSETFRINSDKETIKDIKNEHRDYWNLGRLLREIVECFGMDRYHGTNKYITIYHGANKHFSFESLFVRIKTPLSTTTAYSVAVNFAAEGTILEMSIDPNAWFFSSDEGYDAANRLCCFDCQFISDFTNEQEIFCIGGLRKFDFNTIINVVRSENYYFYIHGLYQMTAGMSYNFSIGKYHHDIPRTKKEEQIAFRLLSHQFFKYAPNHPHAHEFESCPFYIQQLMDSHCKQIRRINCLPANKVFDLFFRFDNGWIKLHEITAIFPNARLIEWSGFNKDIAFLSSPIIYENILSFIRINSNRDYPEYTIRIDGKFENEIKQIIANYYYKFKQVGWGIECSIYNPTKDELSRMPKLAQLIKAAENNPAMRQYFNELIKNNNDRCVNSMSIEHQKSMAMFSGVLKNKNQPFDFVDFWDNDGYLKIYIAPYN